MILQSKRTDCPDALESTHERKHLKKPSKLHETTSKSHSQIDLLKPPIYFCLKFMHSVLLGSLTLHPLSERQVDRLRKSAVILVKNGKFRAAAMFFQLGHMTTDGITAFLECGQVETALIFLRSLPSPQKSEAMIACGDFLLRTGELERAVPFFAGSQAFHQLLFTLYTLEEGHLAQMWNIIGFDELCNMIDTEFQSLLYNLNVDTAMFFPDDNN
jgi:hypothetical protein